MDNIGQERTFELHQQLTYLPDLTPSDYSLFPKMKRELGGCHFNSDDDEFITAVDLFL